MPCSRKNPKRTRKARRYGESAARQQQTLSRLNPDSNPSSGPWVARYQNRPQRTQWKMRW